MRDEEVINGALARPMDLARVGRITELTTAIEWSAAALTGAALARQDALGAAGVRRGRRVVIAHGGTPQFFADLFAIWSLGACAACVNPDLTEGELANLTEFTEPVAVIAGPKTRSFSVASPVAVLEGTTAMRAQRSGGLAIGGAPDDPALILFTSGTTGDPKGVVHTYGSLAARIALNHAHISRQTLARTLCVLPTHFGHGLIGNCLTPLLAGGHVFLSAGGLAGAAKLGRHLAEHGITFLSSVPAFWKVALKASPPPAEVTLRQVSIGSAPVAADLVGAVAQWAGTQDVRNMYGITETANWIAGGSLKDRRPEDGLIGPMWGGSAGVAGPGGSIAEEGEGEIVVRTPSLMSGYFKRPDLTDAVLRDGWYHTGDTGSVGPDGWLRLAGRLKTEINRGGLKVAPEEVDLLLERHPAVAEACAFGLADAVAGETVAAAVRLVPGQTPGAEALRAWCLARIRRECVPERWFFVGEIPKTDRGKLNRDKVRTACLESPKR